MANDTSVFQEMSKSVDQWCTQWSVTNAKVPTYDSCVDVYDFIGEYEDATTHLSDDQKIKLLNRAFPRNCHRSWYENEIKPITGGKWSEVKTKIIERFSTHGDVDRHMAKLKNLKYDQDGAKLLIDFVDDIVYSYKRAFKDKFDVASCISFLKASLSPNMQANLSIYPEYREAASIEELKRAAKQYDNRKISGADNHSTNKANAEAASVVKELVESLKKQLDISRKDNEAMRKDHESTKKAVVAALESVSQARRPRSSDRRGSSKEYRYYRSSSRGSSKASNSPSRLDNSGNYHNKGEGLKESSKAPGRSHDANNNGGVPKSVIFDSESYFAKFGVPPCPCRRCKTGWHWERHCEALN